MKLPRQCCRPGCARSAVATLTFVYAESTAVIGPLAGSAEPHSWDLCDEHARRITVPRGWEMLRSESGFSAPIAEDYELTALAEAVREVGGSDRVDVAPGFPDLFDPVDDTPSGRHRRGRGVSSPEPPPPAEGPTGRSPHSARPRPGRRGHLRVLPDPID
ncbi:DUF3499 family protein [Gordonia sp. HNM0687]|uniref:DUF3499 family protein n=1 Tax=Gordonia mangrovi TaxID=2665643 RepID=A0A6L7GNB4_9ACTN|nr:DUF3499 domain-containing protein [Gordonia mangrovi]MXP20857.1 DUF3499 family protein [Gordonia mangrovi]UVF78588.1 DUF3499 domain-containing protein [Gordonia mangrovi]